MRPEPERIVPLDDPAAGLRGFVVIDSTARGPAAGGCRIWSYPSEAEARADARRLAAGMTAKNALADLPLGGGKAVIMRPEGAFDRTALFAAFGRAVAALDGAYVTAEDVGTSPEDMAVVRGETRHVAGLAADGGRAGGDPSPWTAKGVFLSLEVVAQRLGLPLGGLRVAVQGVGHVGGGLARHLAARGARLVLADADAARAAALAEDLGAETAPADAILGVDADILAPCALGGAITEGVAGALTARAVVGAANNQLATPAAGEVLHRRGILYAPDYVANAGGIISVCAEYLGESEAEVATRVGRIPARLTEILDRAEAEGLPPGTVADRMAADVVAAAKGGAPCR